MNTKSATRGTWWRPLVALGAPISVFVVALSLASPTLATPSPPPAASTPTATFASPAASSAALAALADMPDAGDPATGYERGAFGNGWGDPDRNGCDARNDTLSRDLTDVVFRSGTQDCVVSSGILHDPYTGMTLNFVRGPVTSESVQIDHLVPLAWAWRNGAASWDDTQRAQFANDPINLLAVDGPTNMAKSDQGPSEWLPPSEAFWCDYAIEFTEVLATYELSVPSTDRGALEDILRSCE